MNVFRKGVLKRRLTKKRRFIGSCIAGLGALLVLVPAAAPDLSFSHLLLSDVPHSAPDAPAVREPFSDFTAVQRSARDYPVRVVIPSVGIDVPVKEASVIGGAWEVFADTAGHGHDRAIPGAGDNIVIYAHARPGLFLNLKNVKIGESIFVFTQNNWYEYKAMESFDVTPDTVDVVLPADSEVLTLYSCSGPWDTTRRVIRAHPIQ